MRNLQPMDLVYDMIRYDMLRCMYLDRYTVQRSSAQVAAWIQTTWYVGRYQNSRGSSDFEDISPAKVHVRPNDGRYLGCRYDVTEYIGPCSAVCISLQSS